MRITVSQQNNVGRVTFGKIAKTETVTLAELGDVDISLQQDGDTLVYDSSTGKYFVKALEAVDGGEF